MNGKELMIFEIDFQDEGREKFCLQENGDGLAAATIKILEWAAARDERIKYFKFLGWATLLTPETADEK